jgi:hypothetical protein
MRFAIQLFGTVLFLAGALVAFAACTAFDEPTRDNTAILAGGLAVTLAGLGCVVFAPSRD